MTHDCEETRLYHSGYVKGYHDAIAMLNEPVDIEIEGGGCSWWYVCEECHGSVESSDKYCRHCGRPFRKVVK